jgi:hypothetical protein
VVIIAPKFIGLFNTNRYFFPLIFLVFWYSFSVLVALHYRVDRSWALFSIAVVCWQNNLSEKLVKSNFCLFTTRICLFTECQIFYRMFFRVLDKKALCRVPRKKPSVKENTRQRASLPSVFFNTRQKSHFKEVN